MQTKSTGSPVRGVVPEPVSLPHDTVAANEHDGVTLDPAPAPPRRSPLAKVLSHLRGDRYMVDAYRPGQER